MKLSQKKHFVKFGGGVERFLFTKKTLHNVGSKVFQKEFTSNFSMLCQEHEQVLKHDLNQLGACPVFYH